jgi:hypothetical protein
MVLSWSWSTRWDRPIRPRSEGRSWTLHGCQAQELVSPALAKSKRRHDGIGLSHTSFEGVCVLGARSNLPHPATAPAGRRYIRPGRTPGQTCRPEKAWRRADYRPDLLGPGREFVPRRATHVPRRQPEPHGTRTDASEEPGAVYRRRRTASATSSRSSAVRCVSQVRHSTPINGSPS